MSDLCAHERTDIPVYIYFIGSDEHCGVYGEVDIINSTLGTSFLKFKNVTNIFWQNVGVYSIGKALGGGTGGYTTGSQPVIDMLRQRSRPYLFSNSVSPVVVGASLKVFEMLNESSELVDTIRENTHHFRDLMTEAGFELTGAHDHPIVAVMIGNASLASTLADDMLEKGIYVIGFSFPVRTCTSTYYHNP